MKTLLSRYLNGEKLNAEELTKIQQALQHDQKLQKEAEQIMAEGEDPILDQNIRQALEKQERKAIKTQLQNIHRELVVEKKISQPQLQPQPTAKIRGIQRWRVPLGVAASVIFIVVVVFSIQNNIPISTSELQAIAKENDSPISLQEDWASLANAGAGLPNEGEIDRQRSQLDKLYSFEKQGNTALIQEVSNFMNATEELAFPERINLILALAQKKEGEWNKARKTFETLIETGHPTFGEDFFQFQIALTYLYEGNAISTKEVLLKIKEEDDYYQKTQDLLKDL